MKDDDSTGDGMQQFANIGDGDGGFRVYYLTADAVTGHTVVSADDVDEALRLFDAATDDAAPVAAEPRVLGSISHPLVGSSGGVSDGD